MADTGIDEIVFDFPTRRIFSDELATLIVDHPRSYFADEIAEATRYLERRKKCGQSEYGELRGEWSDEERKQRDCFEVGPYIPEDAWRKWLDGGCQSGELRKAV